MTKELKEKLEGMATWRLPQLPTGNEIASLVEQKVISTDEARQILFKKEDKDSDRIKALEEQVEFLKDLIQAQSNGVVVSSFLNNYPRFTYNNSTPATYYYTITN